MKKITLFLTFLLSLSFVCLTACGDDDEEEEVEADGSAYEYITSVNGIYIVGTTAKDVAVYIYKSGGYTYCCRKGCVKHKLQKNSSSTWHNIPVKKYKYYIDYTNRVFFNY